MKIWTANGLPFKFSIVVPRSISQSSDVLSFYSCCIWSSIIKNSHWFVTEFISLDLMTDIENNIPIFRRFSWISNIKENKKMNLISKMHMYCLMPKPDWKSLHDLVGKSGVFFVYFWLFEHKVIIRVIHAIFNSVKWICASMCKLQHFNSFNSGLFLVYWYIFTA